MKRDTNTLFFEGTIKGMSPVDTFSEELRGDELESYGINLDDVATILVEMSQLQHDPTDEDRDLSLDRLRVSLTNLLNDLK